MTSEPLTVKVANGYRTSELVWTAGGDWGGTIRYAGVYRRGGPIMMLTPEELRDIAYTPEGIAITPHDLRAKYARFLRRERIKGWFRRLRRLFHREEEETS